MQSSRRMSGTTRHADILSTMSELRQDAFKRRSRPLGTENFSTRPTEDQVTRLIGTIYDAALAPDRWIGVLGQLRDMFGLTIAVSLRRNAERTETDGRAAGITDDDYQRFLGNYFRRSPFLAYEREWRAGEVIRSVEVLPHRVFQRSEMYQEWWRPRDLHEGLRLIMSVDRAGVSHFINLIRPPASSGFGQSEIAVAHSLIPHLRRAAEISRRLNQADALASGALATLDVLRHSVLLLDQSARLIHANSAGDALLAQTDGLQARHGVLRAATPALTNQLHAVLAQAAGAGGVPARAGAMRLARRGGRGALAAVVIPLRAEAYWSLAHRPAILVCVTDPEAIAATPDRSIIELFGLTGAEAALAADLLSGMEPRAIAEKRNRSINTVRTQLARLMAKTDVNRQSDLMRLLVNLPRVGDPI
jgi:DNA-binding CsgD family transcriptional regulator